ncbi:Uncharacterized protein HZ326_16345 [Fusarium oxysporum f. sp. albedinis]|nr:Uncharacterized protein HZ326_16345 [Fusarium oxysporum f. sp. albedinis]
MTPASAPADPLGLLWGRRFAPMHCWALLDAGSLVSQPPFSSLSRDPALSETPIPSSDFSSSHLVATALRGPFGQEHHTLITTVR